MDSFYERVKEFLEGRKDCSVEKLDDKTCRVRCGMFSVDYTLGETLKPDYNVWGAENSGSDFLPVDIKEMEQFIRICEILPDFEHSCCKYGYTDCVCDPLYIKKHHPAWFKDLYPDGDISHGCEDCEDGDGYDNEDK